MVYSWIDFRMLSVGRVFSLLLGYVVSGTDEDFVFRGFVFSGRGRRNKGIFSFVVIGGRR